MSNAKHRMIQIRTNIAKQALEIPIPESGLWFHNDIRNNFYYASYLLSVAAEPPENTSIDTNKALRTAETVLMNVLSLQDQDPSSQTYGHWPLGLDPVPQQAKPNALPAELMGILAVWLYRRYADWMSEELQSAFSKSIFHLYRSEYYAKPLELYHHHEAKYTAAKLIFGTQFDDERLFMDGVTSLEHTLERLVNKGMPEYGALPWFWHWIQAFTSAHDLVKDEKTLDLLRRLLDYLWNERALYYLSGAWTGVHSRAWPHDLPSDGNVGFDYVQFGDFELPANLPRVEYAGLLHYPAPEQAIRTALDRTKPMELRRPVYPAGAPDKDRLHIYSYRTERYAAGGIWERAREFDNEQHRWEMTLPFNGGESVNRLYFFQPGESFSDGDPRHQSDNGCVLYYRSAIMAYYVSDAGSKDPNRLHGVLPKGEWIQRPTALYGSAQGVYFAVFFPEAYHLAEMTDRFEVTITGAASGVVVEAIDERAANRNGISSLQSFADSMEKRFPAWERISDTMIGIEYYPLAGDKLRLETDGRQLGRPMINDISIDMSKYEL